MSKFDLKFGKLDVESLVAIMKKNHSYKIYHYENI